MSFSGPDSTNKTVDPEELEALQRALPILSRLLGDQVDLELSESGLAHDGTGAPSTGLYDANGDFLGQLTARWNQSDETSTTQQEMEMLSSEIDEVATELIQMEMLSRKVLLGRATRQETLKILLSAVRGRLPHTRAAIALADPHAHHQLRIVAHKNLPPDSLSFSLSSTEGPVGQTLRSGAPRAYPGHRFFRDGDPGDSVTVVPLVLGHTPGSPDKTRSMLGAILVVSDERHSLTGGDLEYLRRVGVHGTVLVHNVTLMERLQSSEEMYRTLVEQAQLGMALLDANGRLRHVNGPLREIRDQEVGDVEMFLDWVVPEGRVLVQELLSRSTDGDMNPNPVETDLTTPDGMIPIALSTTPITDQDGEISGHVVIVRNRTIELALETDRRALEMQVQQAEKLSALGKFVAGIAHELNNPLTVVLGYAELLSRQAGLSDKQQRSIEQILSHARRTGHIVEDLLTFARAEKGSASEPLKLAPLIREALTACTELRKEVVAIHLDIDEPLPPVQGSRHALFQVLTNIFSNAMDAMEHAENTAPELYVTLRADTNLQQIDIRDTGPGLAEPKRVFDPFYTTKPIGKGTGLGLSIAYGLIRDHQGDLQASNHPDGGAWFVISLPEVPVSTARATPMGGGREANTG
ncbi:MAG: histidine kinase dimerization/phospho-acceptor domain-containing protein, partial [Myxococcota bacterium]|nr:histidine kinase dimerization/phospho-acceptor domain-containing protein [Myxococcota bacterium]